LLARAALKRAVEDTSGISTEEATMKDGEAPNVFGDAQPNLARHNVQVALRQVMKRLFVERRNRPREREGARNLDDFVRKYYSNQPRRWPEWERFMAKYEFMGDEIRRYE